MGLPCKYEEDNARNNSLLTDCLSDACDKLEKDLRNVPANPEDAMKYCHSIIVPDMNECRSYADQLETITAKDAWAVIRSGFIQVWKLRNISVPISR